MSHADLQTYLVELLMKQDQMSMAASIESRVPFLDHELVEHGVAMPDRFKVRGWTAKAVLREALRDGCRARSSTGGRWGSRSRSDDGRGSASRRPSARRCWDRAPWRGGSSTRTCCSGLVSEHEAGLRTMATACGAS